ncbi:MAG: metallophosphoesterase family protein [Gemmatirosa sp.]|nr:metallophosphoesterase family protein [Gemmatirosa sp.]
MRLAALSDIHGNLLALEAVLVDVARRGVDAIVNVGDSLSGPLQPRETADRLMALDWPTIRGNHERQLLEVPRAAMGPSDAYADDCITDVHRDWMRRPPPTRSLGSDVFVCHGTPSSDLAYFLQTVDADGTVRDADDALVAERAGDVAASLVLCGHSHLPRVVRLPDGRTIVNPGSVGLQAFEWDQPVPHVVANGSPHARYAVLKRVDDAWRVEHVRVAYDWEAAARMADARARPDWAVALRTGSMG